jgi:hypothetical protein
MTLLHELCFTDSTVEQLYKNPEVFGVPLVLSQLLFFGAECVELNLFG